MSPSTRYKASSAISRMYQGGTVPLAEENNIPTDIVQPMMGFHQSNINLITPQSVSCMKKIRNQSLSK